MTAPRRPAPAAMPADWPLRAQTHSLRVAPHDWCVADIGSGPDMLLLHGAGGAGHSFRALAPLLADRYRLLIPDLPGQGFSRPGTRGRLGLEPMAEDLARLIADQGWQPQIILGHSAGAAIALQLARTLPNPPRAIIGINAALGSFEGAAGILFPLLARALAATPFVPQIVSRLWGTAGKVDSLLTSTGSQIEPAGRAQYLHLVRQSTHVEGTLGMMAQWRLDSLLAALPAIQTPTLLIASDGDHAVPARVSQDAAKRMPIATCITLNGYGHLVHEEAAEVVAEALVGWLKTQSL